MNRRWIILAALLLAGFFLLRRGGSPAANLDGQMAPPVQGRLPNGQHLDLADFHGQYVLLDFWGSWCGPCRRANPSLVKLYREYGPDRLVVISVGIERDSTAWARAIREDGLSWPYHLLETRNTADKISDRYGVQSIPAKFLIGPDGRVVASNPSFGTIAHILADNPAN